MGKIEQMTREIKGKSDEYDEMTVKYTRHCQAISTKRIDNLEVWIQRQENIKTSIKAYKARMDEEPACLNIQKFEW